MQDQNQNKTEQILSGPVFDFIIKESQINKEVWNYNGGMIDGRSDINFENSKKGVKFMSDFLIESQPKVIIETGTNYGSFSQVCYNSLDEFELHTCDLVEDSQRCIDVINDTYEKKNVTFYNQHSWDFLRGFIESGKQIDMAWLDSTHTYEYLLQEMKFVAQMSVPYIVVDDFWWVRGIQLAIFDFLKENENYKFYSYSNNNAQIGSIVVLKLV
jgi:hypothetical protein